jgi:ribonuclease P protein component
VVKGCLIANAYPKTEGAPSRLGVITNRKVGPAVGRARARRLLRETYRLHQRDLTCPVDLVLVARPSIVGKTFADVERDFMSALKQMRLINVPPASGSAQAE